MIRDQIEERLMARFSPNRLVVDDVSWQHAGHAGAVRAASLATLQGRDAAELRARRLALGAAHRGHAGFQEGGESHFEVVISASAFGGQGRIAAHRAVHAELADLLAGPVHALQITLSAD